MILYRIIVFGLFVVILLQTSCTCSHKQPNETKVVVSPKKEIKIKIERLEKDLFSVNIDSIALMVPKFRAQYGEFFDLYNHKIIGLGASEDPKYPDLLKGFITDYYMNLNYEKVISVFPDLTWLEKDFSKAFANFHEFFPEKKIPHIYSCISGWNQSVFTSDTLMGISLDKYLGRDCEFYEKLGLDKYKRYTLQREYILPDAFRGWAYTEFEFTDSISNNVLDNMLYEGKVAYFVKQVIPEVADSIVFGFTSEQLKWCNQNIATMWTYLAEHKLLFSTDYLTIRKLVYPAPFTTYYTAESPGRASVWLGYSIIESYMKKNKDITLAKLMKDNDYQKILRDSKFNPN